MHNFVLIPIQTIIFIYFFFNDTATTEIYTLSLHDALPISPCWSTDTTYRCSARSCPTQRDRKSTRLNSSHVSISYAGFCLKKKKYKKDRFLYEKKKKKIKKQNQLNQER